MTKTKNILVAPLNWGLGHATRCIPIINELLKRDFNPIIASDGAALELLKKEFPNLTHIELPSYNIKYTKKGLFLKLKLLLNTPRMISAIQKEKRIISNLIKSENLLGIISDNRFGVYNSSIPSIYITHQITVLSGITTIITSKIHQSIIKKFDECWIPDTAHKNNFSGELSSYKSNKLNTKYIGILSRFKKKEKKILYDYLVILSGPEPQRSLLERTLILHLENSKKNILFIKGNIEEKQTYYIKKNITYYNYMNSTELEDTINKSDIIIARSGYTTIMDLAKMKKKGFFIPTPGQQEQLYLAKRLKKNNFASYCHQNEFCLEKLYEIKNQNPLSETKEKEIDFNRLFCCFKSE